MKAEQLKCIHFRGWIKPDIMMDHRDEWFIEWYNMAMHFQNKGQKIIVFSVPEEMESLLVTEVERFLQSKINPLAV